MTITSLLILVLNIHGYVGTEDNTVSDGTKYVRDCIELTVEEKDSDGEPPTFGWLSACVSLERNKSYVQRKSITIPVTFVLFKTSASHPNHLGTVQILNLL